MSLMMLLYGLVDVPYYPEFWYRVSLCYVDVVVDVLTHPCGQRYRSYDWAPFFLEVDHFVTVFHGVYVLDVGWDGWILRRRSAIDGLILIMLDS